VEDGRTRFEARHLERLARDAPSLGLTAPDPEACREALRTLGRAAFGSGCGVVRLQVSRDGAGAPHLAGVARELGPEGAPWTALLAPFPHPGPAPWGGAKVSGQPLIALARDAARAAGADEAVLLDAAGFLVEGARSNLVVVTADGAWVIPPLQRGGVSGVARALLLEREPGLREADVSREALATARELVAVNAVRGAVPVVRLGGRPLGDGRPGPAAARLARCLADADCALRLR
jgi:branched-subunit amino acid aminotransferase/4-amino-4-deoxychorismate lyase